ncbi:MAG: hypothetical protein AB7S39_13865 [Gemmatimonadales bacterium]
MLRLALLATVVTADPPPPHQTHAFVGNWDITFNGGMRMENGVATPITVNGKLVIELRGDSLVATLSTEPPPGMAKRPDARMAALAGSGEVTFVQRSTAQLNLNGAAQEATAVSTWKLTVAGDKLQGTVDRRIEGMDMPTAGPQPVSGSRAKG